MSQGPTIRVVAAVIERGGTYLITQRRPMAVLPLMWEFPGGRVETGETDAEALRREVRHRLSVEVEPSKLISFVSHPYDNYIVDLYLYDCAILHGEPQALNVHAFRWVHSAEFDRYPFTPADEVSMSKLLGFDLRIEKLAQLSNGLSDNCFVLVRRLIDFLIPPGCAGCDSPSSPGDLWCPACASAVATLPNDSELYTTQGHRLLAPFSYAGPVVQAIHRLKFNNRPELAPLLALRLAKVLLRIGPTPNTLLVPVPATPSRIVERGYNQSALLARALSRSVGLRCLPTGLTRANLASHQVGANKALRAQQVAGAFAANARSLTKSNVILVDDVVTTGATSAACATALQAVDARMIAVVAVARVL